MRKRDKENYKETNSQYKKLKGNMPGSILKAEEW